MIHLGGAGLVLSPVALERLLGSLLPLLLECRKSVGLLGAGAKAAATGLEFLGNLLLPECLLHHDSMAARSAYDGIIKVQALVINARFQIVGKGDQSSSNKLGVVRAINIEDRLVLIPVHVVIKPVVLGQQGFLNVVFPAPIPESYALHTYGGGRVHMDKGVRGPSNVLSL